MKQCRICGITKDASAFLVKRKNGRIALRGTCKQCYDEQRARMTAADQTLERQCTTCGERKPLTAFHKHRICLYGREPFCNRCKAGKRRLRDAQYPERARSVDLKAKYGITLEDYEAMHTRQGGRCAICGTAEAKLVVDHEHVTRRVRSLLCHLCNAMIGCAREDAAILAAGISYLRRHAEGVSADLLGGGIAVASGAGDAPLP